MWITCANVIWTAQSWFVKQLGVSSSLLRDLIFSLLMPTAHLLLPVDVKIVTQLSLVNCYYYYYLNWSSSQWCNTTDTITATLTSRSSLLLPCDSSTRILELLVLLDQHWNYSRLRYPICLLSRTGREMLTFVRSMMEWLGGTISKEDVGEEGTNGRQNQNNKRRRDDDHDEDALGAFALRFKWVRKPVLPYDR